jgi:putative addiction module component (TIGR02574 family)
VVAPCRTADEEQEQHRPCDGASPTARQQRVHAVKCGALVARRAPLSRSPTRRKIGCMTKGAQAVLADALRLDSAARAELASEILASLDGPADPDAEAAWNDEIDRRIEAIEAGTIRLEPWEHVKRRIEKDLLGR